MPGMENLQSVYAANAKRIQESRKAQTTTPDWMKSYQQGLSSRPVNNVSYATPVQSQPAEFSPYAKMRIGKSDTEFQQLSGAPPGYTLRNGQIYDASGRLASETNTNTMSAAQSGKTAAMQFWGDQNKAWNQANEDTLIDRGAMLKELADYKAQSIMNNQVIEKQLSDSEEQLRNSAQETMDRVRNSFAAMGRSASPYVMAGISSRLALQNKDKIDLRRSQLEMDRAQIHNNYLAHLSNVLAETKRTMIDPATAMAMMKELGGSDATGGGGFSGGGGTITTGGSRKSTGSRNILGGAGGRMPVAKTGTFNPYSGDIYASQRGSGSRYVDTASVNQRPTSITG